MFATSWKRRCARTSGLPIKMSGQRTALHSRKKRQRPRKLPKAKSPLLRRMLQRLGLGARLVRGLRLNKEIWGPYMAMKRHRSRAVGVCAGFNLNAP